ncbi:hypothetical protein [Bacteroides xylanisolvens]|uniref:hypothetical protein n=1 Tax=Bacteroides xylanisolvens TaxID=371601 RepID=UPI001D08B63A|nr:hypothetical protein [Bacteroides xylanisolvens]MCB6732694.1 hypothetical protein [Bacteroides xylanisolvens]
MVRLVMLVALLVANLVDAPGISWINYTTLIYDIFLSRHRKVCRTNQKESKRLCKLMNFICMAGEYISGLF